MKVVVLDSSVYINDLRGYSDWLPRLLRSDVRLLTPALVLFELYVGSRMKEESNRQRVEELIGPSEIVSFDATIARFTGNLLRQNSFLVSLPTVDLMIGATALFYQAELATHNLKHFKLIPSLRFFEVPNPLPG